MASNPTKNISIKVKMIIAFIMIIVCFALFMVFKFIKSEEIREKIIWQNRMSVVVNGRADLIGKWVEQQKNIIQSLSENASLRLYFSTISNDLEFNETGQVDLREYLQPLINDRATQGGFVLNPTEADLAIKANINRPRYAGIALTNSNGETIVATANMPAVSRALAEFLSPKNDRRTLFVGPYEGEDGLPTVAIISPVYGINDMEDDKALGFLVGVKLLDQSFFDLLTQPGEIAQTAINYLIRKEDNLIYYLSRYRNSETAYTQPVNADTVSLADGFVINNADIMGEAIDRFGKDVLVFGTEVKDTGWFLVRTVDKDEAYGPVQDRKRNIIAVLISTIIFLCIAAILIWRHAVSIKLSEAVKHQKYLAEKYENLSRFMKMVTDNQNAAITSINADGRYTFVNRTAAQLVNSESENMIGKTPSAVSGDAIARLDEIYCQQVLAEHIALSHIQEDRSAQKPLIYKADYIPLSDADDNNKGVLIVKEDITKIEENRIRKEVGLKSLVSTLTTIISSRDPYSAAHSNKVVFVTKTLTKELNTDEETSNTAEIAAAMLNIGKILVPKELLIKPTKLSSNELEIIRNSMLQSAEMIKDIEFEGPVYETLKQIQAHWDGSGNPKGLSGKDILLSARIISVANAFVGMVSARAYRSGIEINKAVEILMQNMDTKYDRRVVIALMNYIENKDGFSQWSYFSEKP